MFLKKTAIAVILLLASVLYAFGKAVVPTPAMKRMLLASQNSMNMEDGSTDMKEIPIISRKVLFDNPDRSSVLISPDGKHLAWLAPLEGVMNIWVAPSSDPAAGRPVTNDRNRGIQYFLWAKTNRHILYYQDSEGNENWQLFIADLSSGESRNLTPFEGVTANRMIDSYDHPNEIVIGMNKRDPRWHDLYHVDLRSGDMKLLYENNRFANVHVDDDFNLVFAVELTPDGGMEHFVYRKGEWMQWGKVPQEDSMTTSVVGLSKSGDSIYMSDSRGRDTSALVETCLKTGASRILAFDQRADVSDVIRHPLTKKIQAVSFVYERKHWQIIDPDIQPDFDYLATVTDGEMEIYNRSKDDNLWVVVYKVDNGPKRYYLYDRSNRTASFLFTDRKNLENLQLARMRSAIIEARDGLPLVAYISLPPGSDGDLDGIPDRPLPMIIMPHGGPWWRDEWGFDPYHQWLANRGYAVITVNFRGSTGFGKKFINAGDCEWGGKIIEDQIDAVQWAVGQKIADPGRVAIFGGSFGGYSVLAGLTFHPDFYACGIDLVGPSNLVTFMEAIPPYWMPMLDLFCKRIGDFRTEEGKELLNRYSPLNYVDRIRKPLLIGQGANDPRVTRVQSDRIASVMQEKKIPVIYVLYPDEGHGFVRPANNMSFNAIAEVFLAKCLGGRFEPIGDDCRGSSLQVMAGIENIDGLEEASKLAVQTSSPGP